MELRDLKNGIGILRRSIEHRTIDLVDAGNLAQLLEQFAQGLSLLDDYDNKKLDTAGMTKRPAVVVASQEYRALIESMRGAWVGCDGPESLRTSLSSKVSPCWNR